MAEHDDVGIDKQKILKNIAQESASPPAPASAAPPKAADAAPSAPAPAVEPSPAAFRESFWDHRHSIATLVLCMIGVLWLVIGITGRVPLGLVLGPVFIASAAFAVIAPLVRKSA